MNLFKKIFGDHSTSKLANNEPTTPSARGDLTNGVEGSASNDEVTLQPGEWVTLAAKTSTGTAAYVLGSLNTREDQ